MADNQTGREVCLNDFSKLDTAFLRGTPSIPGLIAVGIFYLVILAVGIYATTRAAKKKTGNKIEDVMLAGRSIGVFVGFFTITATWVDGGYLNGTSEYIFAKDYGLVWCQGLWGYSISLMLGGLLFARRMYDAGYVTILDPFQKFYGRIMAVLLFIPALLSDIFWEAAILSALAGTLSVIVGLTHVWSVVISAAIVILYTVLGGLYSVVYTDVIQMTCIFVGVWLAVPFAVLNPATESIAVTAHNDNTWLGEFPTGYWISYWVDTQLLFILGAIPYQSYFQRVFAQKSGQRAKYVSIASGFGCMFLSVPAVVIGAIAKSTDWNATAYRDFGTVPVPACDYPLALPMVMQFLTPTWVAVIGLGGVSAAVMSSADSAMLSSAMMFSRNVYAPIKNAVMHCLGLDRKVSDTEVIVVMRVSVIFVGATAVVIAVLVQSVNALWLLCSDLLYTIVFPQFICVNFLPSLTNSYGSFAGYWAGMFFRFSGGEGLLDFPPLIKWPWYEEDTGFQLFPFKTLTMLISLVTIILVSILCKACCSHCPRLDAVLFSCFKENPDVSSGVLTGDPGSAKMDSEKSGEDQGVWNEAFDVAAEDQTTNM